MAPAHSSLAPSSLSPKLNHTVIKRTGSAVDADTDGAVLEKQNQDYIDNYLFTTSKWILETLTGHGSHYILTIVISRKRLPELEFDDQLCRWLHGDYECKPLAKNPNVNGTARTTSCSVDSPESAPCDTNNDRNDNAAYRGAAPGHTHQAYAAPLHITQNVQRQMLQSASGDGRAIPITATTSHIPDTTDRRFQCILCLGPTGCKICRPKRPTDFPSLSHMWEHFYRCGVYCACGAVLKNYTQLVKHKQACSIFCLVSGPINKWPYGQPPTYELLVAINTAADGPRSINCAFWDALDEDGKRWINNWCDVSTNCTFWDILDEDGKRWMNNWCDISIYYFGHSAADLGWLCDYPWPYTTLPPVVPNWTPRTSFIPPHHLVETGPRTRYQVQQPHTQNTLETPDMSYALGRASNWSSTGASTISTHSSAVFSNPDSMPAAVSNIATYPRPHVGRPRDSFTEASSGYQPADPDTNPAPLCPLEYAIAGPYWQQTQADPVQPALMVQDPTSLLSASASWLAGDYPGYNESSNNGMGHAYNTAAIEALDGGVDQHDACTDSSSATANLDTQPRVGELIQSSTPPGLAYLDPYAGHLRSLDSLDKDELIAVVNVQYQRISQLESDPRNTGK